VAARARLSIPAVDPTYISIVVCTFACPAIHDTSTARANLRTLTRPITCRPSGCQ
jgi:hypothetical protein